MNIPSHVYPFFDTRQVPQSRQESHGVARETAPSVRPAADLTSLGESSSATYRPNDLDRSSQYLDAVRELKAVALHPKHANASRIFLEIAHFEQDPRLVDLYA